MAERAAPGRGPSGRGDSNSRSPAPKAGALATTLRPAGLGLDCRADPPRGRSSMVEPQSSKLTTRVRFPSPALHKPARQRAGRPPAHRRTRTEPDLRARSPHRHAPSSDAPVVGVACWVARRRAAGGPQGRGGTHAAVTEVRAPAAPRPWARGPEPPNVATSPLQRTSVRRGRDRAHLSGVTREGLLVGVISSSARHQRKAGRPRRSGRTRSRSVREHEPPRPCCGARRADVRPDPVGAGREVRPQGSAPGIPARVLQHLPLARDRRPDDQVTDREGPGAPAESHGCRSTISSSASRTVRSSLRGTVGAGCARARCSLADDAVCVAVPVVVVLGVSAPQVRASAVGLGVLAGPVVRGSAAPCRRS